MLSRLLSFLGNSLFLPRLCIYHFIMPVSKYSSFKLQQLLEKQNKCTTIWKCQLCRLDKSSVYVTVHILLFTFISGFTSSAMFKLWKEVKYSQDILAAVWNEALLVKKSRQDFNSHTCRENFTKDSYVHFGLNIKKEHRTVNSLMIRNKNFPWQSA